MTEETVWVSTALHEAEPMSFHWLEPEDISREHMRGGGFPNFRGEVLSVEYFPTALYWKAGHKRKRALPMVFKAEGRPIVREDFAQIWREHDAGAGNIYPVKLFQSNKKTLIEGNYYCLNFGQAKNVIDVEQSNVRTQTGIMFDIHRPQFDAQPRDIVVSAAALGGPDIWVDPDLTDAFFVSEAMRNAFHAAKLDRALHLTPCSLLP
ncbi:MAG: DUF1629 domain-containing protein [Pseudomonadota bacterium]